MMELVAMALPRLINERFVGPPHPTWCPLLWASRERADMPYVSSFGGKYTHMTYPCGYALMADGELVEGIEYQRRFGNAYAKHLAQSLLEAQEDRVAIVYRQLGGDVAP